MIGFNTGDRVKVIVPTAYKDKIGTVKWASNVVVSVIINGQNLIFTNYELELAPKEDSAEIKVGDIIVYFTRKGSDLNRQTALVEFIGTPGNSRPHILVLKQDAEQKDLFTRKSWLWSFKNSVKIG